MSDEVQEQVRELGSGLALRLPVTWLIESGAGGTLVSDPASGVTIRIFVKPSSRGAVSLDRFAELGLAHVCKNSSACVPEGKWQSVEGTGWRGVMHRLVRRTSEGDQRLFYTTLILADTDDPARQNNVSVLMTLPEATFAVRASYYGLFISSRLLAGYASPAPIESSSLVTQASRELQLEPLAPAAVTVQSTSALAPAVTIPDDHNEPYENGDEFALSLAAQGQKQVIYAIVLNFVFRGIANSLALPFPMLLIFGVLIVGFTINGVIKICSGLGRSQGQKILFMVLSVVPLINLVVLIALSLKTTRTLRNAGFEVGLFGAKI